MIGFFFYKKWKLKNKCPNKEREEINDQKEKILPGRSKIQPILEHKRTEKKFING